MRSYEFIPASEQDVPLLVPFVNAAYRGEGSKKGWTTEADLLDGIRVNEGSLSEMISDSNSVLLKCMDGKQLVGCVYLQQQDQELYLGMLTVAPDLQTAGIGKKIMEEAERTAKAKGCNAIVMTVITQRSELIAYYERRGYRLTGEKKPFPNDPKFGIPKEPLEFVVMKKPIDLD